MPKVSPYPIPLEIFDEGVPAPRKASILKLTEVGLIAKVDSQTFLKVADNHQVRFMLPVMDVVITTPSKVIKTYDALEVTGPNIKENISKNNMVELHFMQLTDTHRAKIKEFLVRIKQV